VDNDGRAEAGRGCCSPFRRAGSRAERVILLMRTFLAKTECWLKRRGAWRSEDELRRRECVVVELLFAVAATIGGGAAILS
jgi:hypothetical protein